MHVLIISRQILVLRKTSVMKIFSSQFFDVLRLDLMRMMVTIIAIGSISDHYCDIASF